MTDEATRRTPPEAAAGHGSLDGEGDLLRLWIGKQIVAIRERRRISQSELAKRMERSRAHIHRIEAGHTSVRFRSYEVDELLKIIGATAEETDRLSAAIATVGSSQRGWWHDYTGSSALPEWFSRYVTRESAAEEIRLYCVEVIPGLLQTRTYAENIVRVPVGYVDEDEVERRVNVRIERQALLSRPRAPRLTVILNEATLCRAVGTEEVMDEQLAHLVTSGHQANIIIRVLPFAAGAHGGMAACGPFNLISFPAGDDGEPLAPPLAYAESLAGAMYMTEPEQVQAYRLAWADIEARALDEAASKALIITTMKGHRHG